MPFDFIASIGCRACCVGVAPIRFVQILVFGEKLRTAMRSTITGSRNSGTRSLVTFGQVEDTFALLLKVTTRLEGRRGVDGWPLGVIAKPARGIARAVAVWTAPCPLSAIRRHARRYEPHFLHGPDRKNYWTAPTQLSSLQHAGRRTTDSRCRLGGRIRARRTPWFRLDKRCARGS